MYNINYKFIVPTFPDKLPNLTLWDIIAWLALRHGTVGNHCFLYQGTYIFCLYKFRFYKWPNVTNLVISQKYYVDLYVFGWVIFRCLKLCYIHVYQVNPGDVVYSTWQHMITIFQHCPLLLLKETIMRITVNFNHNIIVIFCAFLNSISQFWPSPHSAAAWSFWSGSPGCIAFRFACTKLWKLTFLHINNIQSKVHRMFHWCLISYK